MKRVHLYNWKQYGKLVHLERDGSRVIPKERTKSVFEETIMLYVYRGVKYRIVDGKRVQVK